MRNLDNGGPNRRPDRPSFAWSCIFQLLFLRGPSFLRLVVQLVAYVRGLDIAQRSIPLALICCRFYYMLYNRGSKQMNNRGVYRGV